ncbi:MAG: aminotransferase class I/II-fold pyridoxal phosphate-dependent enzyme [Coriobacteriia bacterium]|nr:aminotransferase class I/II-fold pyridoxal phosphate-dependent enzyme [Coriobacteriia bacterium]
MTAGEARVTVSGADLERLRSLSCIKWSRYDDDVIPAWVADMDLAPLPAAVDSVAKLAACGDFGYNFAAHKELPELFSEWEARRHGWRPDVERTRVFCDVMQAVETVLWLHTEPGDGVVLFTPVYHPFYPAVKSTGRRVVECPLDPDGWRLDPERLEAAIDSTTRAILLCNPHNPTGRVLDAAELTAIADVAERHDLLIVSDEIWGDLVHPGATHVPLASVSDDAAARTVTISAASKAFNIAGLHCAVAHIGHAGVEAALKELPRHLLGAVGTPGAMATRAAWTEGELWLGAVREHLTAQRDHLAMRLASELPEIGFTPPEGTYLAWLDMRAYDLGDDPAKAILERGRVALSSGLDFGHAGAGWARLNFATSREILDEIIDRVASAVRG